MSSPLRNIFRRDATGRTPAKDVSPLDPSTWTGALVLMAGFTAVLFVIQAISSAHSLTAFGLRPRTLVGLRGIVLEPFLHADWHHLLSNTLPLLFIGWVLMLAGLRTWLTVTAIVILGGGALTWLVAPGGQVIVGASGMIFGWLAYLLARAYFSRDFQAIFIALAVLFFFGTLLFGLFPALHSTVSWQAHVCGFVAGIGAAGVLHQRGGGTRFLGAGAA